MNLEEALQINYELAELALLQVQNSNSFTRWKAKHLSEQLREIQLTSNQCSFTIQHTRILVERNICMLEFSEPLNSQSWTTLLDAMELNDFIIPRVRESDIAVTMEAIEKINDQICSFHQAIQPQIEEYNRLVQSARSWASRPFDILPLFKLPKAEDLPIVLNTAKLTIF